MPNAGRGETESERNEDRTRSDEQRAVGHGGFLVKKEIGLITQTERDAGEVRG